ncbi:MAG: LPS-assembly protein LptD [Treponema sp.]|nr:LPS-assembly protein LptD [Treponema sp.]
MFYAAFLALVFSFSAADLGAQTEEEPAPGLPGPADSGPAAPGSVVPDSADSGPEAGEDAGETAESPEAAGLTEEKILGMDIRTSTLQELAAWCRELGLSEGGGREELAARLRAHYRLEGASDAAGASRFLIIESARSTEYFTLETVDEEYARLRGNVIISLKEENATHRIQAQEILYNRTRNQVTARGTVSYVKEEGDTVETFRGDTITVNLDSWATMLTDGISERGLSGENTTYRFEGNVISRSEEEVTILEKASITNASAKNSYWSLNASKLWLLPGSDFALANAVLKVGEIPVFYIPFFYYPADEIIFHPVLGYRSREGNFIQTTTYILGRPKPEDLKESSLTKILGSGTGMEKEQHGIFLRSTGKKAVNPSETSLKALIDVYANLGAYFGLEMKIPGIGVLKNFELSAGLGRTRDIKAANFAGGGAFIGGASYTPYPRLDGESDWNSSQLFSWHIPLRYRFRTAGSLSGKAGDLSWEMPYYSDPFVDRDFLNRSESMDWFRIIQEGAALNEASATTELSSYEWRLSGKPAFKTPSFLSPYVNTISFSNFYSALMFTRRESEEYKALANNYSPSRWFYFPDKFTLYSLGFSIGGTPLRLGKSAGNSAGSAAAPGSPQQAEDPFKDIGTLRPPWEGPATPDSRRTAAGPDLTPPALGQRFDLGGTGGPLFSIDYRLEPATISELQYMTGRDPQTSRPHWAEARDINWNDISSVLSTVRGGASTTLSLNDTGGFYSNTFRLRSSGAYQNYFYVNKDAGEFGTSGEVRNTLNRIYNATFFTTNYDYAGTIKPLYRNEIFKNSSFSYSFGGLVAKSVFDPGSLPASGTSVTTQTMWDAQPRWNIEYGAWDKEHMDSHQLSTILDANVMDKTQNFTLTLALPPRDSSLAGNLITRIWIGEFQAEMRVLEPWAEEKRKLDPFRFTGTLRFGSLGSLKQYVVYDMEKKEYSTLTSNLSLWGFSVNYTAVNSVPYEFVQGTGWRQSGDARLHSQDLRFGFAKNLPTRPFRDQRLSLSYNVNSSLLIDLQRYTYSRFDIRMGFTFGFKELLDLSFSVVSDNSVVYRYLRNIPGMELPIATSGESNFFKDLLNSFRFDNKQLREESGFKLKSLNLNATHYMGDWNATLGIALAPYLQQPSASGGVPSYQFNTQVSFVIQWLPISEIKSEFTVDKDQWVFK